MTRIIRIRDAAKELGIPYHTIYRACQDRLPLSSIYDRKARTVDVDTDTFREWYDAWQRKQQFAKRGPKKQFTRADIDRSDDAKPKKRRRQTTHSETNEREKPKEQSAPGRQINVDDVAQYLDMTLRQILQLHGSTRDFDAWLKAAKTIADIEFRALKSAVLRGDLVAKQAVERVVLGPLDTIITRLVEDAPKKIATRIEAEVKRGKSGGALETAAAKVLARYVKDFQARSQAAQKALCDTAKVNVDADD